MSAPLLSSAQFFTTVAQLQQLPATGLPEVAFVGRSNSGKSSAINKLCNRNRLAFASRTPGRTQALNYFGLGPSDDCVAYLVDTPGYGYAAAPGEVRRQWDTLAGRYLGDRDELRGVVLMVDIRRLVGERDIDLLRWIAPHIPILALLTKADKLARMHQRRALDEARDQIAALGLPNPVSLLLFSSLKGTGIEAARRQIEDWLAPCEQATTEPTTEAAQTRGDS
ncbi:MAG: ribosome biogenesis GTP-binding protein YihA/YsxC [Burkholderiaceae bacterium]|nr:ribosome biogenesis GTP-binding protein YihA/YsxC [Burkholderiaceae bacterium]MCO5120518.1 ribosome biogenesis GTP-binding protein YihA/YsxC [Burkholderiaceae bacterium]MEB2320065.1 ribosome biogenesis GTP-binding protein YihA/YsxC [Pseudomonadota bacterium]